MAVEFPMPKLGLTMEAGTITSWLVANGATVAKGDPIVAIETDKVESDVEASGSGILHQTGRVGDEYACGVRIGWFLEPGEEPPTEAAVPATPVATTPAPSTAAAPAAVVRPAGGRLFASPNARRVASERGIYIGRLAGTGPNGRIVTADVLGAPAAAPNKRTTVAASFAARKLADQLGINLSDIAISGADPRVDRQDVVRHVRDRLATGTPSAPDPIAPLLQEPTELIAMRGMRGVIAERMYESLQTMAQLTLTIDVTMDAVIADRDRRKAAGAAPGYTDYVIAAAALALQAHPIVNSQITLDAVALLPHINIGLAVALDGGLIVPVVHDAASLTLDALSNETTRLATAARSGGLTLAELEGGTFSVTALGMYGVDAFTPVINPPNTAILGVGRLRDVTVWADDRPARSSVLTLSLTWDHRAFDGAPAAEFAATVRDALETWNLDD